MLRISQPLKRLKGLRVHTYWFAAKPVFWRGLQLTRYLNCEYTKSCLGFIRIPKYAQEVNLALPVDELVGSFRENTRYEIRRAEREGLSVGQESDSEAFRALYDRFAEIKGLARVNPDSFRHDWPIWLVTKVVHAQETLVMHAHVADPVSKRVSLLHSISLWRDRKDGVQKNQIARANRYLQYRDFIFFKDQGYERYDFGLVGKRSGQHPEDHFKDSFGPTLMNRSEYLSIPLWMTRRAGALVNRAVARFR